MMFAAHPTRRIFLYGAPVDMRKSFTGLIVIVQNVLKEDPLSGHLYAFLNRRGNYMKSIVWDRTGYCLFAKRLEQGRFRFPEGDGPQEVSAARFQLLLDGIVLDKWRRIG